MGFSSTYLEITYTLIVGVIVSLSWVFSLKREVAVLQKEVSMNKDSQDKINIKNDDKFENIDSKLDKIIGLLIKR